jgi:hypothetical protein
MNMGVCKQFAAVAVAFGLVGAAYADTPAPGLQDLVSVRGSSGETELEKRGYTVVRSDVVGDSERRMYWRETSTGRCVAVRLADGRYQALTEVPREDCAASTATPAAPLPADAFATVCGVLVDGRTYRYKCTVSGAAPGGPGETVLNYPDQKITLKWLGPKRLAVTFEGMHPQELGYVQAEGNIEFNYEGSVYMYTYNRESAALEVKNFRAP